MRTFGLVVCLAFLITVPASSEPLDDPASTLERLWSDVLSAVASVVDSVLPEPTDAEEGSSDDELGPYIIPDG